METINENFGYQVDYTDKNPIVLFTRDREAKRGERWVATSLSPSEVKKLYWVLKKSLY